MVFKQNVNSSTFLHNQSFTKGYKKNRKTFENYRIALRNFFNHVFRMFSFLGCPLETLLRQQKNRDLPKVSAFIDDDAADILEKKVPPYRPPGTETKNLASITKGLLEETGINVLVHPIKTSDSDDSSLNFNGISIVPTSGPYFDVRRSKNVTALKGVTSNLVCRVRRLGNHTV